jgi:hypothetical protein
MATRRALGTGSRWAAVTALTSLLACSGSSTDAREGGQSGDPAATAPSGGTPEGSTATGTPSPSSSAPAPDPGGGPPTVRAPLSFSTTSLPDGTVPKPFSATVAATGGTPPYTFGLASGALPNGLLLDAKTGAVTGAPSIAGSYTFKLNAVDASAVTASREFTISILHSNDWFRTFYSTGNNAGTSNCPVPQNNCTIQFRWYATPDDFAKLHAAGTDAQFVHATDESSCVSAAVPIVSAKLAAFPYGAAYVSMGWVYPGGGYCASANYSSYCYGASKQQCPGS